MAFREFRKTTGRSARPNVWLIRLDPEDPAVVVTQWGLLDGAMQETRDRPGGCGVKGHANYQTPEDYAQFCMDRDIRKKMERGYVEYVDGEPVSTVATSVRFGQQLPKNLTFYKPKTEISDKKLSRLEEEGRAVWTLKRDGMMHVAIKHGGRWEIYSRRMDLATDRFPHIIEMLERLRLPNETILLGEIVLLAKDGGDDFKGVSRICRSDPDLALAYQGMGDFPRGHRETVLGKACFYVFDVAFYNGRDFARKEKVLKRLGMLKQIFGKFDSRLQLVAGHRSDRRAHLTESKRREALLRSNYMGPVKIFHTDSASDVRMAAKMGIEGFVVLDSGAVYGDKGYSFDGKAQRPDGIWKRKPKFEDEFIITDLYEGTGRNMGKLGGFYLEQVHPDTGKRISCGKCGGGLTDAQREEFWREGRKLVGKTIKVEFDSRQKPKDGVYAVRFPVFKGFADKKPDECIAQGI